MKCQQCQKEHAVFQLHVSINNEQKHVHLCKSCFQKISKQSQLPSGFPFTGGITSGSSGLGNINSFTDAEMNNWLGKMFGGAHAAPGGHQKYRVHSAPNQNGGGLLDELGNNLSAAARAGLIDPVIGRDAEISRVIETLNRRNKNNPVLIGEPGVGKTAIAEGLALQIVEGKVPSKIRGKEVYVLDVASLVANTGIRGQFEERMQQLVAELQQRQNVILFIDEIHLLVGAGKAEGSMDAGNILKPALARGEIQVIGATTLKEYRLIEKDAALERRLQPVLVKEPSVEEAIQILKGLAPRYEEYHQVVYPDEAIEACVKLAHRYVQDRFLPDKAIDLLDEAGAKLNLELSDSGVSDAHQNEARLVEIQQEKEAATNAEDYERAAALRDEELQLRREIEDTKNKNTDHQQAAVTVERIERIIEQKTGIPVRKMEANEQEKLKYFEQHLAAKVIGQAQAVQKVAKAIRRSRAGLKSKTRPIGSFLFVGPTGVGKTELAKSLTEELYGDANEMIRLDMSEYMEKHSVSKLIGSPPGYVGHEEAGQLTEKVRRNPYSVILLDEIEKAHPDVQHIFLQIMEDGRLTDSQGKVVNFKDTVLIMTSNAGVVNKAQEIGFSQGQENDEQEVQNDVQDKQMLQQLRHYFKPEFLNRIDSIIQFQPLTETDLLHIVDLLLAEVVDNLKDQKVTITVQQEAKRKVVAKGYNPEYGARPLRRAIQEEIEDRIADLLLDEQSVAEIEVDVVNDEIMAHKIK